jgi:hypothetical protein
MLEIYNDSKYLIRRKIIEFFGGNFDIYDSHNNLVLFAKLKAFKLKEDIRLYESKEMKKELLNIKARQIIDFGATYDVIDSTTGEKVGALKRKGLKSILKDEWIIMDSTDAEIARIREDNAILALVRRFLTNLIPQKYNVMFNNGMTACEMKQNFNPFVTKISVNFFSDSLDKRLGLAAGILLCAIEGK